MTMSGSQGGNLNCRLGEVGSAALRCWWLGWCDAWANRSFPFRYDRWHWTEQLNYESGRLYAANVRASGFRAPPWNGTRNGVGAISLLCDRSERRLGDPMPAQSAASALAIR